MEGIADIEMRGGEEQQPQMTGLSQGVHDMDIGASDAMDMS